MKSIPFSKKFLVPLSTVEGVSQYLEKAIVFGELKPGSRLIERDLAETLGVSRIPIREAFRILEVAGLVKIIPRKGAQVTAISPKEIEDIYTLRAHLVSLAAKLAASHAQESDLQAMSQISERMTEKMKKNDFRSYFELNVQFHHLLAKASGNQKLKQILENLGKQTFRFRYISLGLPGRLKLTLGKHQQLIAAIKNRNGKLSEKIAKRNIEGAKVALLKFMIAHPENFDPQGGYSVSKIPIIKNYGSLWNV